MDRKPSRSIDVPPLLVAALLVVLVTAFAPFLVTSPDLPAALPPVATDERDVLRLHSGPAPATPRRYVTDSFQGIEVALDLRDPDVIARASREYAAWVADAGGRDDMDKRHAMREFELRRFLARCDRGVATGLPGVAARHGLCGPSTAPGTTRANRIAWFDLRWEALAANELLRSEEVALDRLATRIPPAERLSLLAWALRVDCHATLGAPPGVQLAPVAVQQCADVRHEMVTLARTVAPGYPADEADAAVDVLSARAFAVLARGIPDAADRAPIATLGDDAMRVAHAKYDALARGNAVDPPRRWQRYWLGSAGSLDR